MRTRFFLLFIFLFVLVNVFAATVYRYDPVEVKDAAKFNRIDIRNKYFYPGVIRPAVRYTFSYELGFDDGFNDGRLGHPNNPFTFQKYDIATLKATRYSLTIARTHKKHYIQGYRQGYVAGVKNSTN